MTPVSPDSRRALHATLSPMAAELLDLAVSEPAATGRPERLWEDLPAWVRDYPYSCQAWPTFVSGAKLAELRHASVALPALYKAVPERVFGDDVQAMASFYGFNEPRLLQAILQDPNGIASALVRSDFVDTETGFQCLEMNMSACLGGWQVRFLVGRILEQPWIRDLLARHGAAPSYVDPFRMLLRHLVREAARTKVAVARELNTVFMVPTEKWASRIEPMLESLAADYAHELAALDEGWTGELLCTHYEDIRQENGRMFVDGVRVHAAIEYHEAMTHPLLFRSFKSGLLNLYNGPGARLLGDKRTLALLSEGADSGSFDAAERALIERHVPWTRSAVAGETTFEGERVVLPRFAIQHRERLVLKPALGSRGEAVSVGEQVPPGVWERAVEEAFATGRWILQERVDSLPYVYPGQSGEPVAQSVIWGMFAFSDIYGGCFLRMMPQGAGRVVNSAKGAREGVLIEIEAQAG